MARDYVLPTATGVIGYILGARSNSTPTVVPDDLPEEPDETPATPTLLPLDYGGSDVYVLKDTSPYVQLTEDWVLGEVYIGNISETMAALEDGTIEPGIASVAKPICDALLSVAPVSDFTFDIYVMSDPSRLKVLDADTQGSIGPSDLTPYILDAGIIRPPGNMLAITANGSDAVVVDPEGNILPDAWVSDSDVVGSYAMVAVGTMSTILLEE